jgi:sugar phosphate isomerase/epimerase
MMVAIILGLPLPLLAIHVLLVNLLTDSIPALALGADVKEEDVMEAKPRPKGESLFANGHKIGELAKDLGTDIITTHIGVIPSDKNHDRYKIMQEACFELSRFADSMEAHFAIETGPETADVLKGFLDDLGSDGVAVNLDPANFKMVTGFDPVEAVYLLKDYIVHTHAKDGNRLNIGNPEYIYKAVHPVPQSFNDIQYFEEVPLGTGSVDFPNYLKALEEIGYKGFLTIEREVGDTPEKDIITAYNFLNKVIAEN